MTCDGHGVLPCRCGAAEHRAGGRDAPCSCDPTELCPSCDACRAVEAQRAREHAEALRWYEAKIGTAPPRAAKGRAKDDGAKGDTQGNLFK